MSMIKKLLIGFGVVISCFLFTDSISAATITGKNVNKVEFSIDENVIYETLKNNGIDVSSYNYIIINQHFTSENAFTIYLFNDIFTFIDIDARTNSTTKNLRSAPANIEYTVIKYNYDNTIANIYNYISNGVNSSSVANWNFNSGYFTVQLNTSANTVAYSNYNTGISGTYGSVYNNYLTLPEFEPDSYEFNEDIDVSDISKIKINFKLPTDTSNLELKLDFSVKGLTENAGIIGFPYISLTSLNNNNSTTNVIDFDYNLNNKNILIAQMCDIVNCYDFFNPNEYTKQFKKTIENLEKIDSNNSNKSTLILNELNTWYTEEYVNLLYDHALNLVDKTYMNNNNYSDSFNLNLLPDSTVYDYSLEINTIDYTGILNLSFISNLNYSISYECESEVEDYYLTLDLNNYAAVVLIPRVININSSESNSFLSDIYLSGIYDIELWEDINSKNVLFRHSNYSSRLFSHYFDYRYPNAVLYFIKKDNFNGNASIKIDTRYYSYLLLSSLSSGGTVINPNTNQEIIIPNISDLYDYDFKVEDITGIKDNIQYFFKNIESLGKKILEPVQTFFDSLPSTMKVGIIVLFVLFLTVGIIKMNL